MAITEKKLRELLQVVFVDAEIAIKDLVGDNDHYEVVIATSEFSGKSKIQQHRMVNDALKGCLGGALHALSIKTKVK